MQEEMMATLLAISFARQTVILLLVFSMVAILEVAIVVYYSKKGRIPDLVAYASVTAAVAWFLLWALHGWGGLLAAPLAVDAAATAALLWLHRRQRRP